MHSCKSEKSHLLSIFYNRKTKAPLTDFRVECGNGKLGPREARDSKIKVDTTESADFQRDDLWTLLIGENDKEIGTLIYNLRRYRAVCEHLGIFLRDNNWKPYQAKYFNVAPAKDYDMLCDTLAEVIGDKAAAEQRKAFTPQGRASFDEIRKPKAKRQIPEFKPLPIKPLVLPKAGKPATAAEIANKTVVMVLTFHGIGNRRKVSTDLIELKGELNKGDKEWLAVSKKLIEAPELDAINSKMGETRRFVEGRALPSAIKKGVYLLPVFSVTEMDERLTKDQKEIHDLAGQLAKVYAACMKQAEERLGPKLFNLSDYLTADQIRDAFTVTWRYIQVNTPASLEDVDKMILKKEQAKWEKQFREAAEAADTLLSTEMSEIVKRMIERLTPDEKGKPKIIRETFLPNVTEWLQSYDPKNINNNNQLKAMVDRAKEIIKGVNTEVLRDSPTAREFVKSGFEQIDKLLTPMVVTKPSRAISFDEV